MTVQFSKVPLQRVHARPKLHLILRLIWTFENIEILLTFGKTIERPLPRLPHLLVHIEYDPLPTDDSSWVVKGPRQRWCQKGQKRSSSMAFSVCWLAALAAVESLLLWQCDSCQIRVGVTLREDSTGVIVYPSFRVIGV